MVGKRVYGLAGMKTERKNLQGGMLRVIRKDLGQDFMLTDKRSMKENINLVSKLVSGLTTIKKELKN